MTMRAMVMASSVRAAPQPCMTGCEPASPAATAERSRRTLARPSQRRTAAAASARRRPARGRCATYSAASVRHREVVGPAVAGRRAATSAERGSSSTAPSAGGQRVGVAGLDEQGVDAVGGDVAVAVEAAGDDRRAGRHRLDQHDAERLAVQRRRAEHVGAPQAGELLGVADPPEPRDARVVGVLRPQPRGVGPVAGDPQRDVGAAALRTPRAARRGPCAPRGGRRRRSSGCSSASAASTAIVVDLDAVEEDVVLARRGSAGRARGRPWTRRPCGRCARRPSARTGRSIW